MTAKFEFPTSDEDSSTPDEEQDNRFARSGVGFRPLTRIHLLLTSRLVVYHHEDGLFPTSDEDSSTPDEHYIQCPEGGFLFPTSDEDSSTPDTVHLEIRATQVSGFRPLTRIHLLLTTTNQTELPSGQLFPTSDEDSSTPDWRR